MVRRVRERLQQADDDLDDAHAYFRSCKREWSLINATINVRNKIKKTPKLKLVKLYELLSRRLCAYYKRVVDAQENDASIRKPRPHFLEVCVAHAGLAQSYGLMHYSEL